MSHNVTIDDHKTESLTGFEMRKSTYVSFAHLVAHLDQAAPGHDVAFVQRFAQQPRMHETFLRCHTGSAK